MSKILVNQYYNELHRAKQFGGSKNETSIRNAFLNLVNGLARPKNLELITEISIKSTIGTTVRPDGVLRNILQLDYGFWESKDTKDDIFEEIDEKFKKGYPKNNIIFEDTQTAVLFQEGKMSQVDMSNPDKLLALLNQFITYERPEVQEFNTAISRFSEDLPAVLSALRKMIDSEMQNNKAFSQSNVNFLQICKSSINPNLTQKDVWEMLIQHILTEEIFMSIFQNVDYHRENNIAQSLYEVEKTFFIGQSKQNLLASIRPYYNTIKSRANELISHVEKQKFLKTIYENFYKAYNPKGADRLGIVYTPNEIVKFMIESTDILLDKHFNKTLGSKGVEILDPCTGTGTFITELIEHIAPQDLIYKYENEIYANEVALLPYYVANLNIEAVFQQKMGTFREFTNLCFVDTLDNTEALAYKGKQNAMFGSISLENITRIKRQNDKKISVIIGNPPYNAMQKNSNENNANRKYLQIDNRIKETFVKSGTAQLRNQLYDMYVRFYRWATDRISDDGILSFVSNRSFIEGRTFDGFRKEIVKEFQEIYIIDLKGDIRKNEDTQGGNVFDIMAGVCVVFFVRNKNKQDKCRINYYNIGDFLSKKEKLNVLRYDKINQIPFERIFPDKKNNWLNQTENDFDSLIPVCDKDVKNDKNQSTKSIFYLFSRGVTTSRDEWSYDLDKKNLEEKSNFFIDFFKKEKDRWKNHTENQKINDFVDRTIKWTSELEAHLIKYAQLEKELAYLKNLPPNGKRAKIQKMKEELKRYANFKFNKKNIIESFYRPFFKQYFYFDRIYTHRIYQNEKIFGLKKQFENEVIYFSGVSSSKPFQCLATKQMAGLDFLEKTQCLPLYRYEKGEKVENITDWALELFEKRYENRELSIEDRDLSVGNTPASTLYPRISKQ
ncbi:MAG: DNA methyltransferase, partial [Bacteroidetes bacterium]